MPMHPAQRQFDHCMYCIQIQYLFNSEIRNKSEFSDSVDRNTFNILGMPSTKKAKSPVPNPSPKSKVQRKGTGTGAANIILQATHTKPPPLEMSF